MVGNGIRVCYRVQTPVQKGQTHRRWVIGGLGGGGALLALTLGLLSPALAHQVKAGDDVGATLHIEPNDIPQAGVATPLWFALTQRGGRVIPLAECDCQLTLYDDQNQAIATPPLAPVNAEDYAAIPGTELTFPALGAYTLELTGNPQGSAIFSPFQFRFPVLVASAAPSTPEGITVPDPFPGEPMAAIPPSEAIAPFTPFLTLQGWLEWAGIPLVTGIVGSVFWQYRRSRQTRR